MSKVALAAVAQHAAARGPALLVAFRLADHTNTRGWAWPSAMTLADESGYSRATVLRALQVLEETGELFVERARNRSGNRYRLLLPGIPGSSIDEAPDTEGTVAHSDHSDGDAQPRTVAHSDRSPGRNGRKSAPERSQIGSGTVSKGPRNGRTVRPEPVEPVRKNRVQPRASGVAPFAEPAWLDDDSELTPDQRADIDQARAEARALFTPTTP